MISVCRDCCTIWDNEHAEELFDSEICFKCSSSRVISNNELMDLAIAHIDCDAFYASVEKRDDPKLLGRPVIVGGGQRGVVAACCYVARISGVKSAMPIFEALKRCPSAVIIRPDIKKYRTPSNRRSKPIPKRNSLNISYLN